MNYDLISAENIRFDLGIPYEFDKRLAFHQAGHAVAICLGNKQRRMPEVYFQITMSQGMPVKGLGVEPLTSPKMYQATIDGGRLIQNLPLSFAEATQFYSKDQSQEFFRAFEADVINLLAGPIAEAKYVAYQDDEIFNRNLINLTSLHYYGGKADPDTISEYMACFVPDEKKTAAIIVRAFQYGI